MLSGHSECPSYQVKSADVGPKISTHFSTLNSKLTRSLYVSLCHLSIRSSNNLNDFWLFDGLNELHSDYPNHDDSLLEPTVEILWA